MKTRISTRVPSSENHPCDAGESKAGQLHTDLRPLELVQVLVRAEQALDGLDVLLLLEARKGVEVVDGLGEDLGLLEALAVVAPLRDQGVDDERRLGQRQRVDVLELAEDHVRADVLVARGQGLGPRRLLAAGSGVLVHGCRAVWTARASIGVEWEREQRSVDERGWRPSVPERWEDVSLRTAIT